MAFFILSLSALQAQQSVFQGRRLFADTSVLSIEITLPIDSLLRDDCRRPRYFEASMYLTNGKDRHKIKLEVRKRAKFRCDPANCSLPPLMVKLNQSDAWGTIFQGCRKLKITHPCRPEKKAFQQFIYKEYLIYRMFNQLTDSSFRVRLAHFTYCDVYSGRTVFDVMGFFIEDDDDLARRIGAKALQATQVPKEKFSPFMLLMTSLFEYMIGNTDFEAETSHNIELLATGIRSPILPVPYDFDWSGLVDAPYAQPALKTGLTKVTQRWYQGPCPSDTVFQMVLHRFLQKKEVIFSEITATSLLSASDKKKMLNYLSKFYQEINHTVRFRAMLEKNCKNGRNGR
ncbi:MAG: hypothetical protein ACP5O2_05460 [Bacteroidales bacterium]